MTTIKFHLLTPAAQLPSRAHATDACYDVIATSREIKEGYITYGLGFSTEIPAGWQAKCYARSGVSSTGLLLCNGVGIIDSDYRGEWSLRFYTVTPRATLYNVGQRIGQIQFEPVPEVRFEVVTELSTTARGPGGFGSTGQ